MTLGGGGGLEQVLTYEGRGEARPSSKIASVDNLCPGGDNGDKTGTVQIKDHIHESFHFVGAVDMCLRKRWIGRRSRRGEIYVPEAVGAVAVAGDGGSVVFDEADGMGGENGRVAVIKKLADGDEGFAGETREKADTTGIGGEWG